MRNLTAFCLICAAVAAGRVAICAAEPAASPPTGAVMGNLPMARPPLGKPSGVKKSSATAASYYTAEKLRDPFMKATAGGAAMKSDTPEEFSIHNLTLRGMLKDRWVDYAVFTDEAGSTFLFRKNKLYDGKRNEVSGVSGTMDIKQKIVNLITLDKDVQVFRLGQKDEEEEDKKN